jgi:hypothetical protein
VEVGRERGEGVFLFLFFLLFGGVLVGRFMGGVPHMGIALFIGSVGTGR